MFFDYHAILQTWGSDRIMRESYWWYILYLRAGAENRVILDLKRIFESKSLPYSLDPFYPEAEQYYRNKRYQILGHKYRKRPLFPGYVFIETDIPEDIFLREFSNYFYHSTDIVRLLKREDGQLALPLEERQRFEYLFRGKRCLEHSVGYIIGDKIVVESGPLLGREGTIKKLNRHNQDAIIEIEMFGEKMTVKVALEIVSKIKQEETEDNLK